MDRYGTDIPVETPEADILEQRQSAVLPSGEDLDRPADPPDEFDGGQETRPPDQNAELSEAAEDEYPHDAPEPR